MRFINHHKLEWDGQDQLNILIEHLIARDYDLEFIEFTVGQNTALSWDISIKLFI